MDKPERRLANELKADAETAAPHAGADDWAGDGFPHVAVIVRAARTFRRQYVGAHHHYIGELVEDRKNHPDSPYLFPSPRAGGMWSPDAIGRAHKALLRAAGIDEGVRFHDIRNLNVKPRTKHFYSFLRINTQSLHSS